MKKLLGMVLSLALLIPSGPASAELFKNLKVSGSMDLRMNSSNNSRDFSTRNANAGANAWGNNDRIGAAITRTVVTAGWDLLDDIHGKVTLRKNDRTWGNTAATAGTAGASGSPSVIGAPGTADVASNVMVDEASVKIDKLFDKIDTTVGRQWFQDEENDFFARWGKSGSIRYATTQIDAVSGMWDTDWAKLVGIAGKTTGQASLAGNGTAQTADVDVRGFYAWIKGLPVKASVQVWNRVTHGTFASGADTNAGATATGKNDNLWVYGFKVRGEGMGAWFNFDLAFNGGENRTLQSAACNAGGVYCSSSANYVGKAFWLRTGYKADVSNVATFAPWFHYGWGTGRANTNSNHNQDFTSITNSPRQGLLYGKFGEGTTNVVALGSLLPFSAASGAAAYDGVAQVGRTGFTNRIIWGLGLKATPAGLKKLTTGFEVWDYWYQKATVHNFGNANAAVSSPQAKGNRHIGYEYGVTADWKHSDNLSLALQIARFQPGGYINEVVAAAAPGTQQGVNPANMVNLDWNFKF
ncbi:MAG: hypothetical protein HY078_14235 [Elusimicrobia bacterium]|nr:hypothetical protein [Elusimicrobiota bacterium]